MTLLGLTAYGVVLAAPLAGLAIVGAASPAQAHAGLEGSDPAEGATLEALPDQVQLTFTEEIGEPAYVAVRTPDGSTYEDGAAEVSGRVVTQQLTDAAVDGKVTIAYRVVSTDGHPVTGEFTVTVSGAPESPATPDTTATPEPTTDSAQADNDPDHNSDHNSGHDEAPADDDSGLSPIAVALIVVAVLVLGGAAVLVSRARRRQQ